MSNGLNYHELGLRVGLEIHIQLNTRGKLFCRCPTALSDEETRHELARYLRPAMSEVGEVDPAAILEWKKGRIYRYEAPPTSSCLVETDEEPPHEMDEEALLVALTIARAFNMKVFDEIHVMRKIVLDGSNVSGFQRTSLIAFNGFIVVEGKRIGVQTLCLEEDAARKIAEEEGSVKYRLDRLGIPLVEIATAPDINSPEEAEKVALRIGQTIKLTGKAKRGLGTVRQDLNVSIRGGAKIEIKGVQYLYMIPRIIEYEVLRQLRLIEIRDELLRRGVNEGMLKFEPVNITELLRGSESKLVKRALSSPGSVALALPLPGFRGLLGKEVQPGRRFGTELADYARVWGGVGGLIHSDELPGYGISGELVDKIYGELGLNKAEDAFIIVMDAAQKSHKALQAVYERAKQALRGVPEETRGANPDGTTRYMRPRPGSARMYPETDIPPILITPELLELADKYMPEPPEARIERYVKVHGLSEELANKVINDPRFDVYEYLASKYGGKVPCSLIASVIVNVMPALRRDGVPIDNIDEDRLEEVLELVANNVIAKEAIPDVLKYIAENPGASAKEAAEKLGIKAMDMAELDKLIESVIQANREKIFSRKEKAFQIVMSEVMKVVRGKVDGGLVAERVRAKLNSFLST